MRALITGSHGFIGREVVHQLQAASIPFDIVVRHEEPAFRTHFKAGPMDAPGAWHLAWPHGLTELSLAHYTAVVHLATARSRPNEEYDIAVAQHTTPVDHLVRAAARSNPECHIIFVSSQSATPAATSSYGRGKWLAEQVLRGSHSKWSVVQPGLVVGPNAGGLFGSILAVIKRSPLIPIPTGEAMQVQPVTVKTVAAVICAIVQNSSPHHEQKYSLALAPCSLFSLVGEVCRVQQLRRLRIPIPWRLIWGSLALLERLPIPLPVSRVNLSGLLHSDPLPSLGRIDALGVEIEALTPATFQAQPPTTPTSAECTLLCEQLFRASPTEEILQRYQETVDQQLYNGRFIDLPQIIERRLDAEAVEFAARRKGTELSQKFQALCYIAELSPHFLPHFISHRSQRLRGIFELFWSGVRSAWKLIYGHYLIWRFKLLEPRNATCAVTAECREKGFRDA
jgi:nucleoside-diphosphate-sugar epimerase